MAKQPFRSIGQRLRTFAHSHIHSYIPSGNVVSRVELPPSWEANISEPLMWREDAPPSVAAETSQSEAPEVETPQLSGGIGDQLLRILAAHEENDAQQAALRSAEPPPVQREVEASDPVEAPPRTITRRRRGSVIDVPSTPSSAPAEEETPPDFFFLNEPAPDDVQGAPEPTPPPAPRRSSQQPIAADSSETSFWRGLFSPGGDTPDISTERSDDADAFTSPADDYENFPQESPVDQPSSAETYNADAPRAQRKTVSSAQRRTAQPDIQRDADQSRETSAADAQVPTAFEADLPAGAEIAPPPTPTAPHAVQRQTNEVAAAFTPPVQPNRPAEPYIETTPDAPAAPHSAQRSTEPTSQQPGFTTPTNEPHTPSLQRETSEPTGAPTSPVPEVSPQNLPDVATPFVQPTVQRQIDTLMPERSSTQTHVDEPPPAEAVPQATTRQSTIQRQAESDVTASFETDEGASSPISPEFPNPQGMTTPPSRTPPVQRRASEPNQNLSQTRSSEPAALPPFDTPGQPAPQAESQPTAESRDALTSLTPTPEPQSPPRVQRKTGTPHVVESPVPEFTEADAPTMLTEAAPPPVAGQAPAVQRQITDEPVPEVKRESRMPEVPPSPWTEFMRPAERKPERVKRPTPPPVQRAPEPTETASTSAEPAERQYRPSQDDTSALPEQPVDLFTALTDAGMVNTPTMDSAPPQISRRTAPDPASPSSAPQTRGDIPTADSVEADLLSLIDMPPDTPIIRQSPGEPRAARAIENSPEHGMSQSPAFTPPTIEQHAESLDSLMFERAPASPDSSSSSGGETAGEGQTEGESGVDVDKLARDVLGVLRKRLRTERERRGGSS